MENIYKNLSLENIEGEYWLPVFGYEEFYEISNLGRIKSLGGVQKYTPNGGYYITKIKILKQPFDKNGYLSIGLHKDGKAKTCKMHRLVAQHFLANPENKPEVNHKKGIKTDNRATEIEWSTSSHNQQHAYDTGLKKKYIGKDNKLSTPVAYFKNNELIKRYNGMREAERDGFKCYAICRAIQTNGTHRGFLWCKV